MDHDVVGLRLPRRPALHPQAEPDAAPAPGRFRGLLQYRPGEPRENREPTERFRPFTYEELAARDKVNLDITLVRDPSLDDAESLLPPDVIAREIVEDLEAALSEFAAIAEVLQRGKPIADGTTD